MENNHIHCDNCGNMTETREKDINIPRFGKTFNFRIKDAEVCPNCSETYITAKSAKKINRHFKKLALT